MYKGLIFDDDASTDFRIYLMLCVVAPFLNAQKQVDTETNPSPEVLERFRLLRFCLFQAKILGFVSCYPTEWGITAENILGVKSNEMPH